MSSGGNIPFTVGYDAENHIVCGNITGDVDHDLVNKFAEEICRICEEHDCDYLLNDWRNTNLKFSTVDIYSIPQLLLKVGLRLSCKRALVVGSDFEDWAFFETVSRNRGQNVKVFKDYEEAKKWLLDKKNTV